MWILPKNLKESYLSAQECEDSKLELNELAIISTQSFMWEIESFVIENLVKQMEQGVLDEAPIWSNLKTFNWSAFRGKIHGITGGYPCQPFSVAGRRKGKDDPRHLWPYIKEGIRAVRPVWCFFENVPGHLELGYREVRSDLESLGYKVKEGIFSAEEVGAPHQRKRLFILAVDNTSIERFKQEYEISAKRNSIEHDGETGNLAYSKISRWNSEAFTKNDEKEMEREWRCRPYNSSSSDSIELGNSRHSPERITEESEWSSGNNSRSNEELVNSTSERLEGYIRRVSKRNGFEQSGKNSNGELADTDNSRGRENIQSGELRTNRIEQSPSNSRRTNKGEGQQINRWPARPNEPQQEWESPRVESSLCYRINGYNFREDLLRMAGNAVVEQVSELAFRTLVSKL